MGRKRTFICCRERADQEARGHHMGSLIPPQVGVTAQINSGSSKARTEGGSVARSTSTMQVWATGP